MGKIQNERAMALNSMDDVVMEMFVSVKSLKERFDRHSIGWETDLRDVRTDIKEIRAAQIAQLKVDHEDKIKMKEDIAALKANNGYVSKFFMLALSGLVSFLTAKK